MSESVISQNNNSSEDLSAKEPTVQNDIKDNGDVPEPEDSSPAKKIKISNDVKDDVVTTPAPTKGRPSKASTAKRLNILEKTAKEGEAMLQNMGHKAEDEPGDGNRRVTRSRTRGTPPATATPPKKEKTTPKSTPSKKDNTPNLGTPKRRGRPPKNSVTNNSVESKTEVNANSEPKKPEESEPTDESQEKTVNNSNNETNNNTTNDENVSEESNSTEQPSKPEATVADEKPPKEEAEPKTEQKKDSSAKTNSISGDTSKSVPVLDTQQSTKD